jgi:mono/diheme cytochrome c family protein
MGKFLSSSAPRRPPTPPTYIVPADMGLVIIVVILIVALGLGAFLLGMRRPSGAPDGSRAESKAAQRGLTAGLAVVCTFGLAVPALVLAFNGEHKASVGVGGVHLNAQQQKGRELFSHSCNLCHTLAGAAAVGRTGPNLDVLIPTVGGTLPEKERYAARKAYVLSAILEGRARGKGQMPKLLYQGNEAEAAAAFVAAIAGH